MSFGSPTVRRGPRPQFPWSTEARRLWPAPLAGGRDLKSWPEAVTSHAGHPSHWPAPVPGVNRRGKLLRPAAAATRSGHPLRSDPIARYPGHPPRPDTVASCPGHQPWPCAFTIRLCNPPWLELAALAIRCGQQLWRQELRRQGLWRQFRHLELQQSGGCLRSRSLGGSCQSSGSCEDTTWPLRFDLCWLLPAWAHGT